MPHANDLLRGQLEAYSESWKKPHEQAMEYWDLREMLRLSLALYDAIVAMNKHWCDEVDAGRKPFERDDAKVFERMYRTWDAPTAEILRGMGALENLGFAVEDAPRFRAACRDVRLKLNCDIDELLESEKELREGRGIPLAEVRDELRRRRLAAGK